MGSTHFHTNEQGLLVRCYHQCRVDVLSRGFWFGVTLSFPIEHFIWEKLWPFKLLTKVLGL